MGAGAVGLFVTDNASGLPKAVGLGFAWLGTTVLWDLISTLLDFRWHWTYNPRAFCPTCGNRMRHAMQTGTEYRSLGGGQTLSSTTISAFAECERCGVRAAKQF
jgi:hypothetical protein